jgi:hypothetical protein
MKRNSTSTVRFAITVFTTVLWGALTAAALMAESAQAGRIETSTGFSFSRSNYGNGNYQWVRRWGASLGYHFTETSEIELSMQDVVTRTRLAGYEDTNFHDQIYAINWVQGFFGRDYLLDPYVKVGIGQLNRDAAGSYGSGGSPTSRVDSVTGIMGAGLRINFSRRAGIRCEANTYLTGGSISTWRDNVALNIGFSLYF